MTVVTPPQSGRSQPAGACGTGQAERSKADDRGDAHKQARTADSAAVCHPDRWNQTRKPQKPRNEQHAEEHIQVRRGKGTGIRVSINVIEAKYRKHASGLVEQ